MTTEQLTKLEKLRDSAEYGLNFVVDNQGEMIRQKLQQKAGIVGVVSDDETFEALNTLFENDKETLLNILNEIPYDNNAQNYTGGILSMTEVEQSDLVATKSGEVVSGILTVVGGLATALGTSGIFGGASGTLNSQQLAEIQRQERERQEEEDRRRRQNQTIIISLIVLVIIGGMIAYFTNKKKKSKK